MDGPLPEIVAPIAPFSISLKINSGFEFRIDDVAIPLSIDAFQ